MKKFFLSLLVGLTTLFSIFPHSSYVVYAQDSSSCTTISNNTSVVEDLKVLDKYDEKYITSTKNSFITFTQAFDSKSILHSYVYLNYIGNSASILESQLFASISTSIDEANNSFKMYKLSLISYDNNSSFKKYEVKGLDNLTDETRRYEFEYIYYQNPFGKDLQKLLVFGQKHPIYYFHGASNESIESYVQEFKKITITDKQVAFFCYGDSMTFFGKDTGLMQGRNIYTDAWFVFFNTDYKIDNLISIDISYVQIDFCVGSYSENTKMDYVFTEEWVNNFVNNPPSAYNGSAYDGDFKVKYDDVKTVTIKPGTKEVDETQYGWFNAHKTTYETLDNIMDLRKYKAQDEDTFVFTDYADTYTWGVHFNDTHKSFEQKGANQVAGLVTGSIVTEVTILKLTFETDYKVKTLLAIDTPSKSEDNQGNIAETPKSDDLNINDYLKNLRDLVKKNNDIKIVSLILLIVLCVWLFSFIFGKVERLKMFKKKKGKK